MAGTSGDTGSIQCLALLTAGGQLVTTSAGIIEIMPGHYRNNGIIEIMPGYDVIAGHYFY